MIAATGLTDTYLLDLWARRPGMFLAVEAHARAAFAAAGQPSRQPPPAAAADARSVAAQFAAALLATRSAGG